MAIVDSSASVPNWSTNTLVLARATLTFFFFAAALGAEGGGGADGGPDFFFFVKLPKNPLCCCLDSIKYSYCLPTVQVNKLVTYWVKQMQQLP